MAQRATDFDGLGDALAALRSRLNQLHRTVGQPTYRQLRDQAALAGLKLPISTAHELLMGSRMPRWTTVEAFMTACLGHAASRRPALPVTAEDRDLPIWQLLYDQAEQESDHRNAPAAPQTSQLHQPIRGPDQWQICVTFILSLDTAHNSLRGIARAHTHMPDRRVHANRAVQDSGLYAEREKLLAAGSSEVVIAGESAFLHLIAVRDAIRNGAELEAVEYHRAYHPFAEALWAFRMAIRAEFGQAPLTPKALNRADWLDHERCTECGDFR